MMTETNSMYSNKLANEPVLMPWQYLPFNGDTFVADEFLKLKSGFEIKHAVELGTCVGGTTKWLGENFDGVLSIEINPDFLTLARERCKDLTNISFFLGSTVDRLEQVLKVCDNKTLIFIDSHWHTLPIFDELKIIKASGLKPIIVIHDFLVPTEQKLGYDSYQGTDISMVNLKSFIDEIYGDQGYEYHYNTAENSTEVKRGVIYIYPKK